MTGQAVWLLYNVATRRYVANCPSRVSWTLRRTEAKPFPTASGALRYCRSWHLPELHVDEARAVGGVVTDWLPVVVCPRCGGDVVRGRCECMPRGNF